MVRSWQGRFAAKTGNMWHLHLGLSTKPMLASMMAALLDPNLTGFMGMSASILRAQGQLSSMRLIGLKQRASASPHCSSVSNSCTCLTSLKGVQSRLYECLVLDLQTWTKFIPLYYCKQFIFRNYQMICLVCHHQLSPLMVTWGQLTRCTLFGVALMLLSDGRFRFGGVR